MATLRCDGNATTTVMDGGGWCNGNAMAMTAMERGDNSGGAPTSGGCNRSMLANYGQVSVHLKLLSFGYKYGGCAPGHVSKFNGLLYLVRRSLLQLR